MIRAIDPKNGRYQSKVAAKGPPRAKTHTVKAMQEAVQWKVLDALMPGGVVLSQQTYRGVKASKQPKTAQVIQIG